jgi:hypothetical protein
MTVIERPITWRLSINQPLKKLHHAAPADQRRTKDGRSNNRELTNARVELDHWRARLLKVIHKG